MTQEEYRTLKNDESIKDDRTGMTHYLFKRIKTGWESWSGLILTEGYLLGDNVRKEK